jgi:chemotaxis protein histidine kinase CheA
MLAFSQKEQYAKCNQAMLNDFEGMTPDEMMECAEILEAPLKKLEEENKAREAAEREAAKKKKAEEEKRAAAMAAAKKKAAEDAAAIAMQKAKERDEQKGKIVSLEAELGSCQTQFSGVMVAAGNLAQCESVLNELEKTHVKVDPRLKPLFGSHSLEVVVGPALTLFCILFCLLGAYVGTSRVTPMINPSAGSGVSISEVIIRPGNEVCIVKNRTFNDVVSSQHRACFSTSASLIWRHELCTATLPRLSIGPHGLQLTRSRPHLPLRRWVQPCQGNDGGDSRGSGCQGHKKAAHRRPRHGGRTDAIAPFSL